MYFSMAFFVEQKRNIKIGADNERPLFHGDSLADKLTTVRLDMLIVWLASFQSAIEENFPFRAALVLHIITLIRVLDLYLR